MPCFLAILRIGPSLAGRPSMCTGMIARVCRVIFRSRSAGSSVERLVNVGDDRDRPEGTGARAVAMNV